MSYSLFSVIGIELEYMIVDRCTLNVRPIADKLLERAAGEPCREWENGPISWCNELALHVIEFKFTRPRSNLADAVNLFQTNIVLANDYLSEWDAVLMPTAMHPWMNPHDELQLWPHEDEAIYSAYNRIFDCRGHGWANLQSTHINLPFANDSEFIRLHAAIRVVLALLPGLAASSPAMDGKLTGALDNRIIVYRDNAKAIPSVTGKVIPEPVGSISEYNERILVPMYRDIAPYDSESVLQDDWLNSRGAIARFERGSIEIRLLDIQECVSADITIVRLVVSVVKALAEDCWVPHQKLNHIDSESLVELLMESAASGDSASVENPQILACFGVSKTVTLRELWIYLAGSLGINDAWLTCYGRRGVLARGISESWALNGAQETFQQLVHCLECDKFLVSGQ